MTCRRSRTDGSIREVIPYERPSGMQCFVFNLRKPIFQDVRGARGAGLCLRFRMVEQESLLSASTRAPRATSTTPSSLPRGLPGRGGAEDPGASIAARFPMRSSPSRSRCRPPTAAATTAPICARPPTCWSRPGWIVKDGKRVNKATGEPFRFEILLDNPLFERIALPFIQNLKRLGIDASLRTVDAAQYPSAPRPSISTWWSAASARACRPAMSSAGSGAPLPPISRAAPISSASRIPSIDALIEQVISAPDREQLIYPRPRASTGCCSGTTTSFPISTWAPIASPIGTSSAGRRSGRDMPSASTPGGSIRRRSRT